MVYAYMPWQPSNRCPRSTFVISPRGQCSALFAICTADLNGRGHSLITSFCIRMWTEAVMISLDASEREGDRETRSGDASSLDSLGFACLRA